MLILTIYRPAEAQTTLFIVQNISVDVTASDANTAREIAYRSGMSDAFEILMRRITPTKYQENLPKLEDNEIESMVFGIEIDNERTSNTRYIANLTVSFSRDSIRSLLRKEGIPFTETSARAALVLPVYNVAGAQILWDDPNPWREAWEVVRGRDTLTPLIMPNGDLTDVALIGAVQASRGDNSRLSSIASRYTVQDVLVAEANLRFEIGTRTPSIDVVLHIHGPDGEQITVSGFRGGEGEAVNNLLIRAVREISNSIEENWKQETLLKFDSEGRLSIRVLVNELSQWTSIRDRLESSQAIKTLEFIEISQGNIVVEVTYFGDVSRLSLALAQSDLILREEDGFWLLNLRGGP